jgi:hypothetical protein
MDIDGVTPDHNRDDGPIALPFIADEEHLARLVKSD